MGLDFRFSIWLLALFPLLLAGGVVRAQGAWQGGVFRLRTSRLCELREGESTGVSHVVAQHLYDSAGRQHTVVFFNPPTGVSHAYDWHYHSGDTLVRTDHYVQGRLAYREVFFYEAPLRVSRCDVYTVQAGDTLLYCRQLYRYADDGRLLEVRGETPTGEMMYREQLSYAKPFATLRGIRTKGDKPFAPEWNRYLDRRDVSYDSVGNVLTEVRTEEREKGKRERRYNVYTYDGDGNVLSRKSYARRGGQLLDSARFRYFAGGGLFSEDYYDASGRRVRLVQHTDDRYLWGIHRQNY